MSRKWSRPENIVLGETLTVKRASQSSYAEQNGIVESITPRGIVTLRFDDGTAWGFPRFWLYRREATS